MSGREKKKAKREFESLQKECEDSLRDVIKRIAVNDCLEAYEEIVKSKAYIQVAYKQAAQEADKIDLIDDHMKRMLSAQAQLRKRLPASGIDEKEILAARDLDLTEWPYGKAEEKGKAEGEEEQEK